MIIYLVVMITNLSWQTGGNPYVPQTPGYLKSWIILDSDDIFVSFADH